MTPGKKLMIVIGVAAGVGGALLAWERYAGHGYGGHRGYSGHHSFHGHHGMGILAKGQFGLMAMSIFDSIDADGDGKLTQAEIDKVRNERHDAHDAESDGLLSLDEFASLWNEVTRPITVRVFQVLDTDGDAVVTRSEYDRPFANIVELLDRNGDGALSLSDHHSQGHAGGKHD